MVSEDLSVEEILVVGFSAEEVDVGITAVGILVAIDLVVLEISAVKLDVLISEGIFVEEMSAKILSVVTKI